MVFESLGILSLWKGHHKTYFGAVTLGKDGTSFFLHPSLPSSCSCSFVFVFVFMATLTAYGGSQAMGGILSCSRHPTPQPQQREIRATSATYTADHGNGRIRNPLTEARGQTHILVDPSPIGEWLSYEGNVPAASVTYTTAPGNA